MRVLFEIGRLLLADATRATARKLNAASERLAREDWNGDVGVSTEEDELITKEAAGMIARPRTEPEPEEPPPLKGSLADRGSKVGQPWAR